MAEAKPDWVKMKPAELEKLVVELAKSGKSPSQIGIELRDKHGIPKAKLISKKITKILKENKIEHKTEKDIVSNKIENIKVHMKKNKHDYTAQKSLTKNLWALHDLSN